MAFVFGYLFGSVVTAAIALVIGILAWGRHDCRDVVEPRAGVDG